MKKIAHFLLTLIILSIVTLSCINGTQRDLYPEELTSGFTLLSPDRTGINFENTIKESTYFNHYYYSQMYVGSGVAIGDI
ncbi:MAG: hypothetical protein AAGH46_12265, partial [Bacteroidota bacterium]